MHCTLCVGTPCVVHDCIWAAVAAVQSNVETGEQLSEPPTEHIRWVVGCLELSPQQQYGIARGLLVFQKLLTPVLEERRQLQQQQLDECPSAGGAGYTTINCHAADTEQQYSIGGERGRVLEQQEQRSKRMSLLLHKVTLLRMLYVKTACPASYAVGVSRGCVHQSFPANRGGLWDRLCMHVCPVSLEGV
jgi:hypothetical protein